jgi:malate dehydrogenase (oxaloacetate-decarboxylating)
VNNSLAFPGIFRGAMDTRARRINVEMKVAAAYAIAGLITPDELAQGKIIPGALDIAVPPAVAGAVAQAAIGTGVARISKPPSEVASHLDHYLKSGEFTNDDVVLAGMV